MHNRSFRCVSNLSILAKQKTRFRLINKESVVAHSFKKKEGEGKKKKAVELSSKRINVRKISRPIKETSEFTLET